LKKWEGRIVRYGQRWIIESVFFLYKAKVWRVCLFD
jgi:hypothetical protein